MKTDEAISTSRKNSPRRWRQDGDFAWDPRADQVFTPENTEYGGKLNGASASFDKDSGYSFVAKGNVLIATNDEGTTTWGRAASSGRGVGSTIIETCSPEGQILFSSRGTLVIGDPSSHAELKIHHANGHASNSGPIDERIGIRLTARDVVLSNVVVEIENESGLQIEGGKSGDFSSLTIDQARISVHNGSVYHVAPNAGERRITVKSALKVIVGDDSFAYMGAEVWDFSPNGEVQFSLAANQRNTSGSSSGNYCYFWGFDFLGSTYFPPGIFNFLTENAARSLSTNKGEFVFANIGNGFQWAAVIERGLVAIDGTVVTDPRLIRGGFKNGDLHIHLK